MTTIPIAFAFDNRLSFPASVCIFSLLTNAKKDTFYDIFVLHAQNEKIDKSFLNTIESTCNNCRIQYRAVPGFFDQSYEIRGITTPAYYRLLIPEIIPEYDKVIYSDADLIFRSDLSLLYETNLDNYLLAATFSIGMNVTKAGQEYLATMPELTPGEYIQSGFIMMNTKRMREEGLVEKFKDMAHRKLKYQDQDILNIVCKGQIMHIAPMYNMTNHSFEYFIFHKEIIEKKFSESEIAEALRQGSIHYNGQKPWNDYCANFDQWWEYYRHSPIFDEKFYFCFFNSKIDVLDKLPLIKRIKILARYFIVGRK